MPGPPLLQVAVGPSLPIDHQRRLILCALGIAERVYVDLQLEQGRSAT